MNFPSFWKFLTPLLLGYFLPETGWIFVLLLVLASAYPSQYALTLNVLLWAFGALGQPMSREERSWSSACQVLVEITKAPAAHSRYMEAKVVSGSLRPGQRLLVTIHAHENQIPVVGEFWWLQGRAEWPAPPRISGAYSEHQVLKSKGLDALLKVNKKGMLCHFSANPEKPLQVQLGNRIQARSANPGVGYFIRALLLGDKSALPKTMKEYFRRTGLSHLLAVSGLHVGILFAGLALVMNKISGKGFAAGMLKAVFLCCGLLGYCWLTGFSASVIRASLMLGFAQCLMVFRRKSSGIQILGWVVFFLFALDPEILQNGGFQLSVLAVAGILVLEPRLRRFKPSRCPVWLWSGLTVSFSAQLITAPVVLSWGTAFPTWFLLTNLIAIPLTTFIMYLGLVWLFFVLLSIPFHGLDAAVSWIVAWYLRAIEWMSIWPGSELMVGTPNSASLILVYGIIVAMVWRLYMASVWPYVGLALLGAGWFWNEEAGRHRPIQVVLAEVGHKPTLFFVQGSGLKEVVGLDSACLPLRIRYREKTFTATQGALRPEMLKESDVLIWLNKKAAPKAWMAELPPGIKKYTLQSWAGAEWIRLQDSTDILLY